MSSVGTISITNVSPAMTPPTASALLVRSSTSSPTLVRSASLAGLCSNANAAIANPETTHVTNRPARPRSFPPTPGP